MAVPDAHPDKQRRNTTRREFLRGGSARETLPRDSPRTSPSDRPRDGYLLQLECDAMATRFAVYLPALPGSTAAESALAALELIAELEDQMTVYRDHSEVSRINQTAAEHGVAVEDRLMELFALALDLHRQTNGAFDMTAGLLSEVWGFPGRRPQFPGQPVMQQALANVGSEWIELDRAAGEIRFRRRGITINLGGIGKGYALDRCAELLTSEGVRDFMIHGGQSSVLACGDRQGALPNDDEAPPTDTADTGDETAPHAPQGWTVGVKHPLFPDRRLAKVRLHNRALATSGSQTQFFYHQGKRLGHILDPRTGQPAEGVLSATAIAPSAAQADALATAFYVMGVEETRSYCQRNPEIQAILTTPGIRPSDVEFHSFGLDDDPYAST